MAAQNIPRLCIFQQPDTAFYYIAYTSNVRNRRADLQRRTQRHVIVRHECRTNTSQNPETARVRCKIAKQVIKRHLVYPEGRRVVNFEQTLWYEIPQNKIEDLIGFVEAHCELWNAQDDDDQDDQAVEELTRMIGGL